MTGVALRITIKIFDRFYCVTRFPLLFWLSRRKMDLRPDGSRGVAKCAVLW
jgi:hypothetical protein